jgi:hypothetical protein
MKTASKFATIRRMLKERKITLYLDRYINKCIAEGKNYKYRPSRKDFSDYVYSTKKYKTLQEIDEIIDNCLSDKYLYIQENENPDQLRALGVSRGESRTLSTTTAGREILFLPYFFEVFLENYTSSQVFFASLITSTVLIEGVKLTYDHWGIILRLFHL